VNRDSGTDSANGGWVNCWVLHNALYGVIFNHSKERFSSRKLIPVNPKTVGDHLLLKRIQANLFQPEVAVKAGVSVRQVMAWEHDQLLPTQDQWQVLVGTLRLDFPFSKA
jgi:DNA-binding transcriptional regulator YiaG